MVNSPMNPQSPTSRASLRKILLLSLVVCILAVGGVAAFVLTRSAASSYANTASAANRATKTPSLSHDINPGTETWNINANGYTSQLIYTVQPDTGLTANETSQDAWYGTVFGDRIMGYKTFNPDGTIAISFLRLPAQSAGDITSFQVYTGVESANQLTMTGTFYSYTGGKSRFPIFGKYTYAYVEQPQVYNWSATYVPRPTYAGPLPTTSTVPFNATWALTANGYAGTIGLWDYTGTLMVTGTTFNDGMVGQISPSRCASTCSAYFIRATSTDFSTFQVYNGSSLRATANGIFVEVAQGISGANDAWSATLQ